MNKEIFATTKLGEIDLKNRLIRSAAGSGVASKNGEVTENVKEWYREVAKGGASMIITEMMTAWDDGNFPEHYLRIDNDTYVSGLQEIASIVHEENSKIIAQIGNYGSLLHWEPKKLPVGPSEVKDGISGITPRPLSEEEIESVVTHFIEAAKRAKKAGFDGVQVHAAHGFLLNKFINPYYNRRTDGYGKDTKGRSKIIVDILKGMKQSCGSEFLVLLKINSSDHIEENYGFTFEESRKVSHYLSEMGFDAIEVSSGLAGGKVSPARPISEIAYNLEHARLIAEEVKVPVILVGGIRSLSVAEKVLKETSIHSIAMTRALTMEPDLVKKWAEGKTKSSQCICCNQCFVTEGQQCILRQKKK